MTRNAETPAAVESDEAPATETVDTPAPVAAKSRQVSATVSGAYFEKLDDHQWTARKKIPAIVKEALDDYFTKHGIENPDVAKA